MIMIFLTFHDSAVFSFFIRDIQTLVSLSFFPLIPLRGVKISVIRVFYFLSFFSPRVVLKR